MKNFRLLLCLLLIVHLPEIHFAQLPAFPGAAGFGSTTPGGRGGVVIEVTNLNDDGPGSLREAINTTGARTIVFRTGGIIELQSDLQLTEPFVTIAGQTAPGDGIVLKNFALSVFTHDIIIRGMRFRPGDDPDGESPDIRDCLTLQAGTDHVIIDHCSFSWSIDENVSLSTINQVTIQWCIISEGLFKNRHPKGPHSMGLLIAFGSHHTSVHHNVLAHNNGRSPLIMGGTNHEFVNNIIYDWGYSSEFLENGELLEVDILGNYWKPLTVPADEHPLVLDFDSSTAFGSRIFCEENIDPNGLFLTPAEIQAFGGNAIIFSDTSLMDTNTGIIFYPATVAFDSVLADAGALHPQRDITDLRIINDVHDSTGGLLDCIYPDPILLDSGNVLSGTDSSIIYQINVIPAISAEGRKVEITNGTGAGQVRYGVDVKVLDSANAIVEAIIDIPWTTVPDSTSVYEVIAECEHSLGSYPAYSSGTPYTDTDHDGMPDDWETANGLDPNDPADANGTDIDSTGYTNLEVYLNGYYSPHTTVGIPVHKVNDLSITSYPNPFSRSVTIAFTLPMRTELEIRVVDLQGRVVKNFQNVYNDKGEHRLFWNGTNDDGAVLPPGIYFIEWSSSHLRQFTKVVLMR